MVCLGGVNPVTAIVAFPVFHIGCGRSFFGDVSIVRVQNTDGGIGGNSRRHTTEPPPLINAIVTNNGRSPIVVTMLRVHVPPEYLGVSGKLTDSLRDVPVWRRKCLLGIRRRLKTSGSRNDIIAASINRAFPRGFARIDVIKAGDTIRVGPQEKASKMVPLNEWWGSSWYEFPTIGELPSPILLIPSCKVAKHRPLVWGPPRFLGKKPPPGTFGIWQMGMNWN